MAKEFDWREAAEDFEAKYGVRFFHITPHVRVSYALVFTGEAAVTASAVVWQDSHVHHEDPRISKSGQELGETRKFYLLGQKAEWVGASKGFRLSFDLATILDQAERLGIRESFVEWTFMRQNSRAACGRASEQGIAWGFGRPHPFKQNFKPNPLLAGPLIDYRPPREEWQFEPVFMKVEPSGVGATRYIIQLYPMWGTGEVSMMATSDISGIPEKFQNYEFPERRKKKVFGSAQHGGGK